MRQIALGLAILAALTAVPGAGARATAPFPLAVAMTGAGALRTADRPLLDCTTSCYKHRDALMATSGVTVTATPASGWRLLAWFGACSGAAPTCRVDLTKNPASVTAIFTPRGTPTLITRSLPVTEFPIGDANFTSSPAYPAGNVIAGADGNLWFRGTSLGRQGLVRITPAGAMTFFPAAGRRGDELISGPDGNFWSADPDEHEIRRITSHGTTTRFKVPGKSTGPAALAAGPNGDLWFTERTTSFLPRFAGQPPDTTQYKLGRITTTGEVTEFPLPNPGVSAQGITAGPDGNVWFTEPYARKIGVITPAGAITEFAVPGTTSVPSDITAGPDGNVWFTVQFAGNAQTRDQVTRAKNKIGRITPVGTITQFPIPNGSGGVWRTTPHAITAGPDGNLWFSIPGSRKIGRITVDGAITKFTVAASTWSIAVGPNHSLWFVVGRAIGEVTLATS